MIKGIFNQILLAALVFIVGCHGGVSNTTTANTNGAVDSVSINRPIEKSNLICMAHRGDWRNFPENSISGLKSLIEKGIGSVEVDVRLTKDGELVLAHDNSLKRTTESAEKVSDLTWDELKNIRLKRHDGVVFDETIPTLKDFMAAAKGKILVNLDMKLSATKHYEKIYKVLLETGTLEDAIWVFPFSYDDVKHLNATYPGAKLCPKFGDPKRYQKDPVLDYNNMVENLELDYIFLRFANPESEWFQTILQDAKRRGIKLYCHTLYGNSAGGIQDKTLLNNLNQNMQTLYNMGFRLIMTDHYHEVNSHMKSAILKF